MEKAVLLSTNPFWCDKMCTVIGHDEKFNLIYEKMVEIRKTRPKIETPFKVYIYCTLQGSNEFFQSLKNRLGEYEALGKWNREKWGLKKGKVIGEFVCDLMYEWNFSNIMTLFGKKGGYFVLQEELKSSCLTYEEFARYGSGKTLYGWHISNLVIYDKPRELSEFYVVVENEDCGKCKYYDTPCESEPCNQCQGGRKYLTKPPQSWCYVEG